jgi:hypothetical protein
MMKKILIGIIIGAVLTCSAQYAWKLYQYREAKDGVKLFEIAKIDFEHKLRGARVLDVAIAPNSKATVDYVYDKLYDVYISYERDGKIKKITTQYGITKGTWISPNISTLEILDDKANTVYAISGVRPCKEKIGYDKKTQNSLFKA